MINSTRSYGYIKNGSTQGSGQLKQKNTIFYFYLVMLFFLMFGIMESYLTDRQLVSSSVQFLFSVCLIIFSLFYLLVWLGKSRTKRAYSIIGIATVFYIFSIFSSLINYGISYSLIVTFRNQSLWFFCFAFFWICTETDEEVDVEGLTKYLAVAFLFFSLRYFLWASNRVSVSDGLISALYFGLMLLPFVFLTKSVMIRVCAICLSVVNTLLSGKRTAFFVLLAALVAPLLIELFGKRKKTAFITVLIGAIGVTCLYGYVIDIYDINLFDRIANITTDGGSGRFDIYRDVLNSFKKSGFIDQLFGHGFNAVFLQAGVSTSAHNDFIEVLYDFGIIGLSLYVGFIIKLIAGAVKLYKVKSKLAPMFLSALASFLVMSTSSHLIIYPTYITFLLLFFVLGIWDLNRILKGRKSENITH